MKKIISILFIAFVLAGCSSTAQNMKKSPCWDEPVSENNTEI